MRFAELHAALIARWRDKDYDGVFALATENMHRFPREWDDLQLRRIGAAAMRGDHPAAMRIFAEVVDAGSWYPSDWLTGGDEGLRPLHGRPEYERLAATCREREERARREAAPSLTLADGPPSERMLLALHGNTENAARALPMWWTATRLGARVGVVQSSIACGVDQYVWGATATGDVRAAMEMLGSPEAERVVLGGFSRGSWHALRMAVGGTANGAILTAPSMRNIEELEPWLDDAAARGLRVVIVAGDADPLAQSAPRIADRLAQSGIATDLQILDGVYHEHPPRFDEMLPDLLAFAFGD